ncbi:MAG: cytochrome C, partial [Anaerolineae bacterium]
LKDPGAYAHGGKYIIQLLYDSIEDLNQAVSQPVDLSNAHRIDHGHFAGSEEAFRHWDEDGAVPASCATCHSADGLPFLIDHGVEIEQPPSSGFTCETCHDDVATFTVYQWEEVEFPSGVAVSADDPNANLCLTCHQGRSSTVQVDQAVGDQDPDTVSESLRFINVHYFAAGATLFGSETQGAYQYAGKEYAGRFEHIEAYDTCVECHDTHMLAVAAEECAICHDGVATMEDLASIRIQEADFDGDGDVEEGIAGEIETMQAALYEAMQAYAADTAGTPILYNPGRYPYFFADPNGNGEIDEGEGSYNTWTPRLLRAAYNYQYTAKDPGAAAHNSTYVMQFLYDGIEDLG